MPTLFESVRNRIIRKTQDELNAKVCSIRTVLIQTAREERGEKIAKPIPVDDAVEVMTVAEPNIDSRRTIDRIKKRFEQSENVVHIVKLQADAAAAETALRVFEEQERAHRIESQERRTALVHAEHQALSKYMQAVEAQQDLIATAEIHPDEPALSEQLTEVGRGIDRCNAALDRRGNLGVSVVIQANSRREQLRGKLDPQRKAQLELELAHWEKAVADRTKELASLTKQQEAIHTKLAKFTAEKLKPENFAIVRGQPSRSDQHALAGAIV